MRELGELLLLWMFALTGLGVLTAAFAFGAGRRSQRIQEQMELLIEKLGSVTDRMDAVDERLADLMLMADEASRPAVSDDDSPPK